MVIESDDVRRFIARNLRNNFKKRGRTLICDIPSLHLKKGHRLEPCVSLPDTFMFEKMATPCSCVFWGALPDDRLLHACPLLTDVEGLDVETYAVDILHSWDLGPENTIVATCLHFWLQSGVFATGLSSSLAVDDKK